RETYLWKSVLICCHSSPRKLFDHLHVDLILNSPAEIQTGGLFMPVAVGTKAPDFTLPAKVPDGPKQIRLSDNFGHKNTLLLFFPMAFTSTCTTEMCEVRAGLTACIGLNADVYGISGANPFAQECWGQTEIF